MRELLTNFRWKFTGGTEEMLIEDGKVSWRGARYDGDRSAAQDQGGKFLLPAFIDSHCHILPTGLDLQKLHLGGCNSREEVLDRVRDAHQRLNSEKWLMAVHYDQSCFQDGIHLVREALDAISDSRPILLRHVSGHASIANSAALRAAGVVETEPDPAGGSFERDARGRMTGVLLEHAHERVSIASPKPDLNEMVEAILLAGEKMHGLGIGCASDMMTGRFSLESELEAYRIASERGCKIRTRLYIQWAEVFGPRAIEPTRLAELSATLDPNRCKIAGIKIFADGAIGSATAAIYGRFEGHRGQGPMISRHGKEAAAHGPADVEVDGQLIYAPDKLERMIRQAHEAGYQISIHSIGDYSTDLVMRAYGKLDNPSRHRIEHAMILSDEQIERMAELDIHCTMQPEFLMRFAHTYKRQLGPQRAARLKRARSVKDAGVKLSLSSDRPIVAGDPWDGIRMAVARTEDYDQTENLKFHEALEAYTVEGARANGDIEIMGALLPGQLADYQFLTLPTHRDLSAYLKRPIVQQ